MANSFFTSNKDSVLAAGSRNFATLISADYALYHLTMSQATSYAALDATLQSALITATDPSTRTKGSVAAKNQAKIPLRQMASDLAAIIDTAPISDEQRIDLGLNVRALPSPVGPPGMPRDFKVTLGADGSPTLFWKINNPRGSSGTIYELWRSVGTSDAFAFIGSTGLKKYVDSTIPAGATRVTYQLRGVRSTQAGPWAQYSVSFGTSAAGDATASVEQTAVKKAA